jgi:hypothetical protein
MLRILVSGSFLPHFPFGHGFAIKDLSILFAAAYADP